MGPSTGELSMDGCHCSWSLAMVAVAVAAIVVMIIVILEGLRLLSNLMVVGKDQVL
jgi:hypothetical protein